MKLDAANPDLTKACFGKPALPSMAPASRGVQDDCVVDKIEQFAKELRDPATLPGERLTALQFLLNFVGDVSDPLFTIEQNDQGGRCVALMLPAAKTPVRLSAYWDDTLVVEAAGKDPAKAAVQIVAGLTPADIQKWSGGSPADWAQESYNVAKEVTYSFAEGQAQGLGEQVFLSPPERARRIRAARCRSTRSTPDIASAPSPPSRSSWQGGVRLAFLLRENLQ